MPTSGVRLAPPDNKCAAAYSIAPPRAPILTSPVGGMIRQRRAGHKPVKLPPSEPALLGESGERPRDAERVAAVKAIGAKVDPRK